MLLHVPEGTESAPQLQRLPGMFNRSRLLGLVSMLATLGTGLAEPPPPPRDPEPTPEELEALAVRCSEAGIDILALGDRSQGDTREFVRLAKAALEPQFDAVDRLGSQIQRHADKPRTELTRSIPSTDLFYFREKALAEERRAKRRMVAEAFAACGAHTVDECEALLRDVGDDQGLAEAAIRIAKAQGIDLLKAARLAVQGGQPLVEQIRAGDFAALHRLSAPAEVPSGREPTAFEQLAGPVWPAAKGTERALQAGR